MLDLNKIYVGNCLSLIKEVEDCSIDCVITSPPYFNLREYSSSEDEIGIEDNVDEYLNKLIELCKEIKRVLKPKGSLWINISDTYVSKKLACIPDRLKIALSDDGWYCRNEIIWHKPNAMPSSAKDRFSNDYEKFYFFTKDSNYKFYTQFEECKSKHSRVSSKKIHNTKYISCEQESSVRQGMHKNRGEKILSLRKNLPSQEDFVNFIRKYSSVDNIVLNYDIKRSKVEHWFRKDESGFSFPSIEDWLKIREGFPKNDLFKEIDAKLTDITYESDDILKNIEKGRIKRSVWSINTKPSKFQHFAMFPEELIITPLLSCTDENDVVLDPFMGSGTTAIVCLKHNRNFIGFDINDEYCEKANDRIKKEIK